MLSTLYVALLAEGVDRNTLRLMAEDSPFRVALLAEGVDRNKNLFHQMLTFTRVALLAEGVDRNSTCSLVMGRRASSPSSRRAWIEMIYTGEFFNFSNVALLAEGVDRNSKIMAFHASITGRPPRGGRG